MGRSKPQASMSPIMPTENVGLVSGFMRKPKRQGKRMRRGGREERGSRRGQNFGRVTQRDGSTKVDTGRIKTREEYNREMKAKGAEYAKKGIMITTLPYDAYVANKSKKPRRGRGSIGRRMLPRPLTGGYNPESGVRYTDTGIPTAVQSTRRVAVQDPTLGGSPEREVPMPRERRQRITRESDPRGGAPFSPDERGMARDRFFERMFDRADERKEQKSMGREERRETSRSMRDERSMRRNEPGEIDINAEGSERGGRRGEGGMRRRRRRGGGMRRRGGRRRDFTRKRSRMEGGRRGRSGREMAEFRDQYVSTLR